MPVVPPSATGYAVRLIAAPAAPPYNADRSFTAGTGTATAEEKSHGLTIDKSKTALLVMDVQNDITHPDSPMAQAMGFAGRSRRTNMLAKLRRLMDACRAKGVLVIHVLIDLKAGMQPRMPHRGGFFQMVRRRADVCKRGTWGGDAADP